MSEKSDQSFDEIISAEEISRRLSMIPKAQVSEDQDLSSSMKSCPSKTWQWKWKTVSIRSGQLYLFRPQRFGRFWSTLNGILRSYWNSSSTPMRNRFLAPSVSTKGQTLRKRQKIVNEQKWTAIKWPIVWSVFHRSKWKQCLVSTAVTTTVGSVGVSIWPTKSLRKASLPSPALRMTATLLLMTTRSSTYAPIRQLGLNTSGWPLIRLLSATHVCNGVRGPTAVMCSVFGVVKPFPSNVFVEQLSASSV